MSYLFHLNYLYEQDNFFQVNYIIKMMFPPTYKWDFHIAHM